VWPLETRSFFRWVFSQRRVRSMRSSGFGRCVLLHPWDGSLCKFNFEMKLKRLAQAAMMRLLFGDGYLNFGVVSSYNAFVYFE